MYVLPRGLSALPRLQPVTRKNTWPLTIFLWSHVVIIQSLVYTYDQMTPITLTGPTVVHMTAIVGRARARAALVRSKLLLRLSGNSKRSHMFSMFES